jgi:Family of unknown function (DUF6088)
VPESARSVRSAIQDRIKSARKSRIWTADDFADLGARSAIDLTLHRMVASGDVRRVARGFYDVPGINKLTGKLTAPDPREVLNALARRGRVRILVDGITAANDLGLTTAVPARIEVLADARLRSIKLGNLTLAFRCAAPSRLYWAGRPAMRVVQALHWVKDLLRSDRDAIMLRLQRVLGDPDFGPAIREDLKDGLAAMPAWMQSFMRELLREASTTT